MNRYIGFIIFCMLPFAIAAQTSFSGAYLGVGAGLINSYFNGSRYVNTIRGPFTMPFNGDLAPYDNNAFLQGAVGYSVNYHSRFNFGIEANVSLDNAKAQSSSVVNEFTNNIIINIDSGYELKSDASLLFKPGIRLVENTLCYFLIGPRWGHFRISQGVDYTLSTNKGSISNQYITHNRIGISVGLGVLHHITQRLALGVEYAYTDFGSLPEKVTYGTIYNNGVASGSITSVIGKTSAKANKIALNIVYRFL